MKKYGIVLWFNKESGEGMVLDPATGNHLYLHYSAIVDHNEFKTVNKKDVVLFSTYKNIYSEQIDKLKVLEPDFDFLEHNEALNFLAEKGVKYDN